MTTTQGPSLEDSIPWANSVFEQPWWLEAVAPGRWGAAEVREDDEIVARLPYTVRRRLGLTMLVQPAYTQTLGPWLTPSAGRNWARYGTEKRLVGQLIESLPPFDHLRMNLSPVLTNWLPFYWAGFQATVRYTYRIEDLSDLDRVHREFDENVRRRIRKALATVTVDHDFPIDGLLRLDAGTYARQGIPSPTPPEYVRRLVAACAARGACRILGAVDATGRTHAALLVVWDDRSMYALISAHDPELKSSGSNTLLFWEAIQLASRLSRTFDFEGSMIEPIEHFMRGFGGTMTPFFTISKSGLRARSLLAARASWQAIDRRHRP